VKIYFAGSIRGGREDKELYLEIVNLLTKYGKVLTEHIGDKTLSTLGEVGPTDQYIYDRDMVWLNEADVVVAEVTTPSLGVGYEIGKMENKKPILCIYREQHGKRVSAMIGGNGNLEFKRYQGVDDLNSIFDDFFTLKGSLLKIKRLDE
jgi:nucleoside 2-deoxyribosyltransferase